MPCAFSLNMAIKVWYKKKVCQDKGTKTNNEKKCCMLLGHRVRWRQQGTNETETSTKPKCRATQKQKKYKRKGAWTVNFCCFLLLLLLVVVMVVVMVVVVLVVVVLSPPLFVPWQKFNKLCYSKSATSRAAAGRQNSGSTADRGSTEIGLQSKQTRSWIYRFASAFALLMLMAGMAGDMATCWRGAHTDAFGGAKALRRHSKFYYSSRVHKALEAGIFRGDSLRKADKKIGSKYMCVPIGKPFKFHFFNKIIKQNAS